MEGNKYGHMIKELDFKKIPEIGDESGKPEYMIWPKGSDLDGQNLNFSWGYYNHTGNWHPDNPGGHIHPYDECLLFGGLDYDNPNDLGAVIEIYLGEENEKYTINTPAVVTIPRGLVHCPLVTKRVDKPYAFSAISLHPGHATTWHGSDKEKIKMMLIPPD